MLAGLAGLAALLLLAILVIKLRNKDGTVIVELDSPTPISQVEVDGYSVSFQTDDSGKKLTVTVPEGKHALSVKTPDGLKLTTNFGSEPVEVAVNDTTTIRAWMEKDSKGSTVTVPDISKMDTGSTASVNSNAQSRESARTWPVGPLPKWSGSNSPWTVLKEGHVLPGIVERPSILQNVSRWNVDTMHARGTLLVARYSPDGQWLATGSLDGHVRIYTASTMKLHRLLPGACGNSGSVDVSWHPDGHRLAVANSGGMALRIWTVNGELLSEEIAPYGSVAWTFDGNRLICGGDELLEVRDANGKLLKTLLDSDEPFIINFGNIAASRNSQEFVCWQRDTVKIWNAETFELVQTLEIPNLQKSGGHAVGWSSQDLISILLNDGVEIFDKDRTMHKKVDLPGRHAAAWHPDGVRLAVWDGHSIVMMNARTGEMTPKHQGLGVPSLQGEIPTAMSWSADGQHLVAAAAHLVVCDGQLNAVEFDSGPTFLRVTGISLSPDGNRIASTSEKVDTCVRIWSADGAAESVMPLSKGIRSPSRVAWSPDGSQIATCGRGDNLHLQLGVPGKTMVAVPISCQTIAWNPDGTRLAAGSLNGHVLILDKDGKILSDIDTNESGWVDVAWSKHDVLVAYVGKKIFRIRPDDTESAVALLTEVPDAGGGVQAVWRTDGQEVCFAASLHVNVADGVTARVRQAHHAAAWHPDGTRYMHLLSNHLSHFSADGVPLIGMRENGTHDAAAGAWHVSGKTIFMGYEQSLVVARNAEDLHVKWTAVVLPEERSLTFHSSGSIFDGERNALEQNIVYYTAGENGNVDLLSPTEFELQIGEEILPDPRRHFDAEYGFAFELDASWKSLATNASNVPGIARATFARPGGVSLNVFVQEPGSEIDASWMLAESVKGVEQTLSATIVKQEVRQVAGRNAMWMVVEGKGTGNVLDGKGPVKTTQHWVAIPRKTDVVVALLTCPSGTFAANEELFLKAIDSLTLRTSDVTK